MTVTTAPPRGATSAPPVTRVLVVDDHELVRRGVRTLVDLAPDLQVVGEAADVAGAMRQLRRLRPDLVVVDVRLPDGDGTEVCREAVGLGASVVVLTAFDDEVATAGVLAAGAAAVLLKGVDSAGLLAGVRRVADGGPPPADPTGAPVVAGSPSSARAALWRLTPRERAVLDLVVEGLSNRRVASELGISEKTVKNHVTGLLAKLGLARRTQAVALVLRLRD